MPTMATMAHRRRRRRLVEIYVILVQSGITQFVHHQITQFKRIESVSHFIAALKTILVHLRRSSDFSVFVRIQYVFSVD